MNLIKIIFLTFLSFFDNTTMAIEQEIPLEQKIGSMIWTGFSGTSSEDPEVQKVSNYLKERKIGGVVLYGGNIKSPSQLTNLIAYFQAALPEVIIAIDGEGGRVRRLTEAKNFQEIPTALEISKEPLSKAKELFENQARQLRSLNPTANLVNLAPVVDFHDSNSKAIGYCGRSFGNDPEEVKTYVKAFIEAFQEQNIPCTLKHYPGHGFVTADSHFGWAEVEPEKQAQETAVFHSLIQEINPPLVMTAHIENKKIDPGIPATLSANTLEKGLRNEQNYQNIIVSDDLLMKAITDHFTFEKALPMAVNAGNDILLFSNFEQEKYGNIADKAAAIILENIRLGHLSEEKINAAYKRIRKVFPLLKSQTR